MPKKSEKNIKPRTPRTETSKPEIKKGDEGILAIAKAIKGKKGQTRKG